jgi:hypothetical protein
MSAKGNYFLFLKAMNPHIFLFYPQIPLKRCPSFASILSTSETYSELSHLTTDAVNIII